jgi:hypothetical protein
MILSNPTPVELRELTDKVVQIYSDAYQFQLKVGHDSLYNWVTLSLQQDGIADKNITMRSYLMKLVEVLDIMKANPNSRVFNAELRAESGFPGWEASVYSKFENKLEA